MGLESLSINRDIDVSGSTLYLKLFTLSWIRCLSILYYFCCRLMTPTNQTFTLRAILEKDKLNGTNYADWIHNLRIVLMAKKNEEIIDTP